jgi:hypothetical protein
MVPYGGREVRLEKIAVTCFSTARSLTPSAAAIAEFERRSEPPNASP